MFSLTMYYTMTGPDQGVTLDSKGRCLWSLVGFSKGRANRRFAEISSPLIAFLSNLFGDAKRLGVVWGRNPTKNFGRAKG